MSSAAQRKRIEDFVSDRGWELASVFEDAGAWTPGRKRQLSELLDQLDGLDKVVVARVDRLGRMAQRVHHVIERLDAGGVDLVSIEEELDTGTDGRRALRTMLRLLADWEPDRDWLRKDWRPESLRARGFAPATVIDVGAARGTSLLYRAFPDAYHVLIEPLREFESELRRITEGRRGEFVLTAIADREGTATINVSPAHLVESSINEVTWRAPDPDNPLVEREVPVTTLDRLVSERAWPGPFGLKIDTEGFEHRVIEGATALLEQTQFVIAEVSVARRFEQSYTFAQFTALMSARGFQLCDVVNVVKDAGGEVSYMDCVFKKST